MSHVHMNPQTSHWGQKNNKFEPWKFNKILENAYILISGSSADLVDIECVYTCIQVFHESTVPPDDFIAHCKMSVTDLIEKDTNESIFDFKVNRTPSMWLNTYDIALCSA